MFPRASLGVHRNLAGKMAVMNQWIVPLEWNGGMEYWNDLWHFKINCGSFVVACQSGVQASGGSRGRCERRVPPPPPPPALPPLLATCILMVNS